MVYGVEVVECCVESYTSGDGGQLYFFWKIHLTLIMAGI